MCVGRLIEQVGLTGLAHPLRPRRVLSPARSYHLELDAELMERIRIVGRTNGVGIDRDVQLLTDAFDAWTQRPTFSRYRSISPLRRWINPPRWIPASDRDGTILFLERVTTRWLGSARRFVLIPNQERYPERLVRDLRHVQHIFCKSAHARDIFSRHHRSVHFLGFTSFDRRVAGASPDYDRFFHLGGGSSAKGTITLLELWARHPEWPLLTVVWHRRGKMPPIPRNVHIIQEYLPDDELRELQNAHGVHLCPSLSEGWGHHIVEAMSCHAVAVVTNGAPMNELVRPGRGILVDAARTQPRKLGVDHFIDVSLLDHSIDRLIRAPAGEKEAIGRAARQWYDQNHSDFRLRLQDLWQRLL